MDDDQAISVMTDLLAEVHNLRGDVKDVRSEIKEFRNHFNGSIYNIEKQQGNTNLAIRELRLSVMHLSDKIEVLINLKERIEKLELAVFKKAS